MTPGPGLSRNARRRLRYFDVGAAAYSALGGLSGLYACPICAHEFTRDDAERGELLTVEHVPPKAIGGEPLCLTCQSCNSRGGRLVDVALADLAESRRMQEAVYLKKGDFSGTVTLSAGGVETNAILRAGEHGFSIEIDHDRNNPSVSEAQIQHFQDYAGNPQAGVAWHMSGTTRATSRRVIVSIIRAGYVAAFAAFAAFGYRFAAAPALNGVRAQILEPNAEHVPRAAIIVADRDGFASDRPAVGFLTSPLVGVAVHFPRDAVVYPHAVVVTLLARIRRLTSISSSPLGRTNHRKAHEAA